MIRPWAFLLLLLASGRGTCAEAPQSGLQETVAGIVQSLGLPAKEFQLKALPPADLGKRAAPKAAGSELSNECEEFQTPIPWKYCLTRTKGSHSDTVLYYLHGLRHDEKSWVDRAQNPPGVRKAWKTAGKEPPIVVSISFGPFWLLSEKNQSKASGLLDFLADRAIPAIERKLGGAPRTRLLMGESMGGFNAIQLVLKKPQLFARAAIVCPAVSGVSPFADDNEVRRYIQRTGADPKLVTESIRLARAVFPSEDNWNGAAPLAIGRTLLNAKTPPLHISCGDKDEYGFYEGAKAFADLARSNGVNATWQSISGGHCAADPEALARFLLP